MAKSGRKRGLTEFDEAVYNAIYGYYQIHGPNSPTIREIITIMGGVNVSSSMVHYSLDKLEEYGIIKRDQRRARSIRLVDEKWQIPEKIDFNSCHK